MNRARMLENYILETWPGKGEHDVSVLSRDVCVKFVSAARGRDVQAHRGVLRFMACN